MLSAFPTATAKAKPAAPSRYPRRILRIAIEHFRTHGAAMVKLSAYDRIVILRAGKPKWVLVRHDYYARLAIRTDGSPQSRYGPRHRFAPDKRSGQLSA